MSAFDKVIGYETIKNELLQICDMIHNREIYEKLGAKMPNGILLYGNPGLGKTLMAKSFIEESGLKAYTVRRNKGNNDFIADITDTFRKAKEEKVPCIVFLEDIDKFANEDDNHRDAEEYVAVQAGIDEVKNSGVFILATANEMWKLPKSLVRSGRFDRKIKVQCPTDKEASKIMEYYLSDKKVSRDVNMLDLSKMISYTSCAELETILNEAAISAAYKRKQEIEMDDLVKSVLKMRYNLPDEYMKISAEDIRETALHEAGHLVVSEVLCPGSVGLVFIRSAGRKTSGGVTQRCKELSRKDHHVLVSLAGKAAVELYCFGTCASGCYSDLKHAFNIIRDNISEEAVLGFGMLDVATDRFMSSSENMNARNEAVTQAELERYMFKTKDILLKNREFLDEATAALMEKRTLLYSDISIIRDNTRITEVAV